MRLATRFATVCSYMIGKNLGTVTVFDGRLRGATRDQGTSGKHYLFFHCYHNTVPVPDKLPVSLAKYPNPSPTGLGSATLSTNIAPQAGERKRTLSLSAGVGKSGPIGERDSRQEKSVERMDQAKREACQDALKDKDVISKRMWLWGVPWQLLGLSEIPTAHAAQGLTKKTFGGVSTSKIRKSKGTKLLAQYPETLSGEITAFSSAAQKFTPPPPTSFPPLGRKG